MHRKIKPKSSSMFLPEPSDSSLVFEFREDSFEFALLVVSLNYHCLPKRGCVYYEEKLPGIDLGLC